MTNSTGAGRPGGRWLTRVLRAADVARLLREVGPDALMDALIDRLRSALARFDPARTEVRVRDGFRYAHPAPGTLEWMTVMHDAKTAVVKLVGYNPLNPSRAGAPTVLATIGQFDVATGHLLCLSDGVLPTALRTGAASAVATAALAGGGPCVLGVVGCGAQAVTQVHALSRVRDLERVLAYDVDPSAAESLAARLAPLRLTARVEPLRELDALLASSDVLCTATSVGVGEGPLFADRPLRPGAHINAVGSDLPGKIELPRALLLRALVVPDHRAQAVLEGESQQLADDQIGPDLPTVLRCGVAPGWQGRELSVFDSTGFALEDQVVLELLLEYALEAGVGVDLDIEAVGADPKNPYGGLGRVGPPAPLGAPAAWLS